MQQKDVKARLVYHVFGMKEEEEEAAVGFDVLLELFSGEDKSFQEAREKVCSDGARQRQKRLV